MGPQAVKRRRSSHGRSILSAPPGNRRMAGRRALTKGRMAPLGRSPGRRVGYAHPPAAGQSPAAGSQRGQGPAAPPPRRTGLPGGRGGAAAFCGAGAPGGPSPAKPTQGAGAKGPRPLRCARCARPPPPPSARVFHRRQKGSVKARPRNLWGRANKPMVRKDVVTVPPPWAKPLPMPYGQRRLHPLRRGLPSQANRARCCATIAVRAGPRRARKIVHLTFFAASCTIGI